MRGIIGWLGVSTVAGLLLLTTVVRADDKDKKVPLNKVPQKVMDAVKARFPGAELTSVEKETEGGTVIYDIELQHKGRKYEMDIKESGIILEIEKEIAAKDLPRTVIKALQAKYPNATIKEIMEVNKVKGEEEKPDHYEVLLVMADMKKREVEVSLDGKTVKEGKAEDNKK